jgi:dTDP-4-dehydrorhamnose 3,5-epimerase
MRAWCSSEFAGHGIDFLPVQANMGFSARKGTLRGLHFQIPPAPEAKLVRCTRGSVFDVVVDLRQGSNTYLDWFGTELSAQNGRMLYLPEQCAHGCLSLEDDSEIHYLTSAVYAPECARGVRFDDPAINIAWPRPVSVISFQDRAWPLIKQARALES